MFNGTTGKTILHIMLLRRHKTGNASVETIVEISQNPLPGASKSNRYSHSLKSHGKLGPGRRPITTAAVWPWGRRGVVGPRSSVSANLHTHKTHRTPAVKCPPHLEYRPDGFAGAGVQTRCPPPDKPIFSSR